METSVSTVSTTLRSGAFREITKPKTEQDDYHFMPGEKQIALMRLCTGQNRLDAHMNRKFKLAPPLTCSAPVAKRTRQRNTLIALPPPPCAPATCVANSNSADDQALWLQKRTGEDDSIHHLSCNDCAAVNA